MVVAGCAADSDRPQAPAQNAEAKPAQPFETTVWSDGPGNGAITSTIGEGLTLSATRSDFYSVIQSICDAFEVSVRVQPKGLVDEEITVGLSGESVESLMSELAEKAGLVCEPAADGVWTVTRPGYEDAAAETIRMSDY